MCCRTICAISWPSTNAISSRCPWHNSNNGQLTKIGPPGRASAFGFDKAPGGRRPGGHLVAAFAYLGKGADYECRAVFVSDVVVEVLDVDQPARFERQAASTPRRHHRPSSRWPTARFSKHSGHKSRSACRICWDPRSRSAASVAITVALRSTRNNNCPGFYPLTGR